MWHAMHAALQAQQDQVVGSIMRGEEVLDTIHGSWLTHLEWEKGVRYFRDKVCVWALITTLLNPELLFSTWSRPGGSKATEWAWCFSGGARRARTPKQGAWHGVQSNDVRTCMPACALPTALRCAGAGRQAAPRVGLRTLPRPAAQGGGWRAAVGQQVGDGSGAAFGRHACSWDNCFPAFLRRIRVGARWGACRLALPQASVHVHTCMRGGRAPLVSQHTKASSPQ